MDVKIVELGPMCLAGIPYYGNPEGGAFGKVWDRFIGAGPLPNRTNPFVYYGLEAYGHEMMTDGNWYYMACVQVQDLSELPGACFGKTLPACTYAVSTARKGLPSIPGVFRFLYDQWLPASEYEIAYPFDFELYEDGRFSHDNPNAEIDIYIPIRKKA